MTDLLLKALQLRTPEDARQTPGWRLAVADAWQQSGTCCGVGASPSDSIWLQTSSTSHYAIVMLRIHMTRLGYYPKKRNNLTENRSK